MITGGAGFVGYHLARRLVESRWQVDLVDNFARGRTDDALAELASSGGARLLERDLTASGALDGDDLDYTHVFHLAAIVGVTHVLARPYDVLRENAVMTAEAIDFARRQRSLERFVFASTSEVYAGTIERDGGPIPTPEDVVLTLPDLAAPRSSYLLSKIYGEASCRHAGLPFTIVRPHNVYGPRMGLSHVIPELLERAHAATSGDALEVFSPDHRRTFCYVDDAVAMVAEAADRHDCEGEVLNVGNEGAEVSMEELARVVARVVGKELRVVRGLDTPGSPRRRCPDMSKTGRLTGVRAGFDLADGVSRTYDWYGSFAFDREAPSVR